MNMELIIQDQKESKMIFKEKDFESAITKRTNIENRLLNLWSKIAVFTEQLTEISREIIEIQKEISSSPLVVDRGVQ